MSVATIALVDAAADRKLPWHVNGEDKGAARRRCQIVAAS
jgi:hypothetical protein